MRMLRKALSVLCCLIMLIGCVPLFCFADDANVIYDGNAGNLIFEPGSDQSPTDLFDNFKNVMPGASLTQKITVRNQANDKVKVKIYLRALGSADETFDAFLNQLTLTVREETDVPLFDAPAGKTAGLTDWVLLGTLYAGGTLDLFVTLDVPTTLDNHFQKQLGKLKWQFVAEELQLEYPEWDCPSGQEHSFHIEEIDGISVFVCDECGETAPMKCPACDGNMREAITVIVGGETYVAYPVGERHYATENGEAHFFLDEDNILDYYTVSGVRTDARDVDEYKLYQYYECLNDKRHHTDPHDPKTGDNSSLTLWLAMAIASGALLLFLLLRKRKHAGWKERAIC